MKGFAAVSRIERPKPTTRFDVKNPGNDAKTAEGHLAHSQLINESAVFKGDGTNSGESGTDAKGKPGSIFIFFRNNVSISLESTKL